MDLSQIIEFCHCFIIIIIIIIFIIIIIEILFQFKSLLKRVDLMH